MNQCVENWRISEELILWIQFKFVVSDAAFELELADISSKNDNFYLTVGKQKV